jgi:hypothetical protein
VDFQRWEGEGPVIVDCEEARGALGAAGVVVEGLSQRIIDIADANGTTPQAVAEVILTVARPATPEEIAAGLVGGQGMGSEHGGAAEGSTGRFAYPASGLGRLTLNEYAHEYGYDLDELLSILAGKNMEVDPDTPLREAATGLGIDPSGVIDALNSGG